ncbi:MAG: DUF3899 domain-containing protein [Bacilli bacterium]|nr:DUF3899 domain-containing protein [Bacilli bacterium]MDY6430360.1 DUF3899 domain-containing protein [Bacilli bacterium]
MNPFVKKLIINSIVSIALATTSFLLIFFLVKVPPKTLICDACFATAAFQLAGIGFLALFRTGIFDGLNYTFTIFGNLFRKDMTKKKYADAYDYKCKVTEKRLKNPLFFYPYLVVGSTFLIVAIIFEFI